jgi:putative membrane protein
MKTQVSAAGAILAYAALAGCAAPRATTSMMGGPAPTPAIVANSVRTQLAMAPVNGLGASDQALVAVAAGAGMYEVEAGRLAASRAADPQVRAYAQMLVDHHTANNNELMALVSSKGHRIAPGLPPELQQKVATLQGLSGPAFDREFVRMTGLQDHTSAIAEFERRRGTVMDRDLLLYVDRTLPALRSHLQQARDLAGRMVG